MKPDLEFVLNRIPWTQNFKQLITATTKTERTKVQTPVYAAPGRIINNSFQIGIYSTLNEELIYVPIGLSQTTDFNTAYYRYGHSGNWTEEDEKRDVTYLPVRKTNLFIDLAREGKYLKGSPFQVYSLHGLEYPFPFMIFDLYNEDQIKVQGFYKLRFPLVCSRVA